MNERYIDCSSIDINIFDNKANKTLSSKEIIDMLNAYNAILEQTEAIKLKMNDSWLLKKFIKK